jgi:hypothetical protein
LREAKFSRIAYPQPQDVDTILPLYLAYRRFYQVEENLGQAREFILKRLQLNESVIFGLDKYSY